MRILNPPEISNQQTPHSKSNIQNIRLQLHAAVQTYIGLQDSHNQADTVTQLLECLKNTSSSSLEPPGDENVQSYSKDTQHILILLLDQFFIFWSFALCGRSEKEIDGAMELEPVACVVNETVAQLNSGQGCPCDPLSQYCWYYPPIRFWLINPKVSSVTNFRQFDYIWSPYGEELNSIQWFRLVFELESDWLRNEPIRFEQQIENHKSKIENESRNMCNFVYRGENYLVGGGYEGSTK